MKKITVPSWLKRVSIFTGPRKTFFGFNSLRVLNEELKSLNVKRLLIVTDPNIIKLCNFNRINSNLKDTETEVFSNIEQEPSINDLEVLAARAREQDYDAVLGLGGGSIIDSAKIAAISATNPGSVSKKIGVNRVKRKGLPLICVPTTSGTGSEVTKFAVIKYERTKKAIVSDFIIPDIAIVDPALTVSLSPKLTAYTGLDALAHAVEAMISSWATPLTDTLSLGTIRLIFHNLKRAYINGQDLEARYYLSIAATMAGLSFNGPRVILAHSIGQIIGPVYGIPHGLSVALALPYMLDFYLSTSANKIAAIGEVIGVNNPIRTEEENARAVVRRFFQLYKELDTPLTLRELEVPSSELEKLAEETITFQPRPNSPIDFTQENIRKVYEKMWGGKV